jgi:hypothetical protein
MTRASLISHGQKKQERQQGGNGSILKSLIVFYQLLFEEKSFSRERLTERSEQARVHFLVYQIQPVRTMDIRVQLKQLETVAQQAQTQWKQMSLALEKNMQRKSRQQVMILTRNATTISRDY